MDGRTSVQRDYLAFHRRRIEATLGKLREIGGRVVVEVGSHPWVMTAALIDDPAFEVCATVSAEEVARWPDDIGVTTRYHEIETPRGNRARIRNYSANVERRRFPVEEKPDTVLACEVVEHLIRSPHVMFLNINDWLAASGKLLVTTPNGSQFFNPFERRSPTPHYRSNVHGRHSYLYTLSGLTDLIALCGFRIVEAGYWDVYDRSGPSRAYGWLARVPGSYFKEKFMKTLFVVAEKERGVQALEKCPVVYDPRGDWEYVAAGA